MQLRRHSTTSMLSTESRRTSLLPLLAAKHVCIFFVLSSFLQAHTRIFFSVYLTNPRLDAFLDSIAAKILSTDPNSLSSTPRDDSDNSKRAIRSLHMKAHEVLFGKKLNKIKDKLPDIPDTLASKVSGFNSSSSNSSSRRS
jgi:hypothetical protein